VLGIPDPKHARRLDAALQGWQQGDVVLGQTVFLHLADLRNPLTPETAAEEAEESPTEGMELAAITTQVHGIVAVSQTCDIVRPCAERPFVELAPLVEVSEADLNAIKSGRFVRYAALPGLEEQPLVVDLERTMTVEKSVLLGLQVIRGVRTDGEARTFAEALARKRSRFAFPDDFRPVIERFRRRIIEKHGKQSPEGDALRTLQEIRVQASPSWDATAVSLFFWFIREPVDDKHAWPTLLDTWLKLISATGRYVSINGGVATLDDMTARDYVVSDRLDLDHLSSASG
jgi:hypothetical protein